MAAQRRYHGAATLAERGRAADGSRAVPAIPANRSGHGDARLPKSPAADWQYQLRLVLSREAAEAVRSERDAPALCDLNRVLLRHDARLQCQFDAFVAYCREAERHGTESYPLYDWTRATIENPAKRKRYLSSFAVHVGGQEIYARERADAIEAGLRPLVGAGAVESLTKHDTNPANNPQPPRKYRR